MFHPHPTSPVKGEELRGYKLNTSVTTFPPLEGGIRGRGKNTNCRMKTEN
jgi:hypothetical protein